jgi:glycosyltransferase involved in cell wall biosynthesis
LNVLWLIDHVCYDGSLHGGGRLFMDVIPNFDPQRVRIFPYFLRSSPEVREVFEASGHPVQTLALGKYDLRTLLRVARLCDEHRVDVMHLFCYASSTFGRLIGRIKGIPTVIHDFDTQVYFPYPFYLRMLDRLLAGSTGKGLAASAACRDYMRDIRGVPGGRLEILPHAIPRSQLQARAQLDRDAARRSLDLGTDFLFAAVTKLGPERGNDALLAAFSDVGRRLPHDKLAIVYKPTNYHRLPKGYEKIDWAHDPRAMVQRTNDIVTKLGLSDSVILVEALDHAELYYQASDVLVAPFENVRFSSANLVDAMAYGRPHIVTDIGEPAELVDKYHAGIKVPVGDIGRLADAMVELASSPKRLATLSENARLAALDLRAEAVAERMARMYETLVPAFLAL